MAVPKKRTSRDIDEILEVDLQFYNLDVVYNICSFYHFFTFYNCDISLFEC